MKIEVMELLKGALRSTHKKNKQKEHLFALSQQQKNKMIYHFHSFAMTSCYIIHRTEQKNRVGTASGK